MYPELAGTPPNQFIALRSNKITEILKWKGKDVLLTLLRPEVEHLRMGPHAGQYSATLVDCNQHYVALQFFAAGANQ